VYPVPAHAYLLPAKHSGAFVAVVAGCPTGSQLQSLVGNGDEAKELGVEFWAANRERKLVPPRICACADDLENLELVLDDLGIPLIRKPLPACEEIASWAGSIDDWRDGLRWIPGRPPETEEKRDFSPYAFRMTRDMFHCPYRLRSMKDSQTEKHRWHVLHDSGGSEERQEGYSFLVDPAWGKWYSTFKVFPESVGQEHSGGDPPIPVPFEPRSRSLVVPAALVFPTMLSRALVTCTGMPPRLLRQGSPHYSLDGSRFLPEREEPYAGACLRFEGVPLRIAQAVCQRVNAEPILIH
jgi:hypothetical protein